MSLCGASLSDRGVQAEQTDTHTVAHSTASLPLTAASPRGVSHMPPHSVTCPSALN